MIDVKAYFRERGFGEPEPSDFAKAQARMFWITLGLIFLGLVVVKILDGIKIKEIIFG